MSAVEKQTAYLVSERARAIVRGTIGAERLPRDWVLVLIVPDRFGTWTHSFLDGPYTPIDMMRFHLAGETSRSDNTTWRRQPADPQVIDAMKDAALALEHWHGGLQWILIGDDGRGALPLLANMDVASVVPILSSLVAQCEAQIVRPNDYR